MKRDIEDLAGQAILILFYLFFSILALSGLEASLSNPWSTDTWLIDFIAQIAGFLFLMLLAATTIVRLPAKNTAAGLEPRISAIMGTFFTLILIVLPKGDISVEAKIVATATIIIGTGLSVYCLYWLGRSFSIMAHARKLVTKGPYSLVRHPLYAAEMITLLGVTLVNFSIWATLAIIITIAFQFRRMFNEQQVLRAAFPEYEDYQRRVPMIVPRLAARRLSAEEQSDSPPLQP